MIRLFPAEPSEFDETCLVRQIMRRAHGRLVACNFDQRVDRWQEALPDVPTPERRRTRVAESNVGIMVGGVKGHSLSAPLGVLRFPELSEVQRPSDTPQY